MCIRDRPRTQRKPRKFERTYKLRTDTTTTIVHNMRTRKVKVLAENPSTHEPFVFKYKAVSYTHLNGSRYCFFGSVPV